MRTVATCKFCKQEIYNLSIWPEDQWMHVQGDLHFCRINGEISLRKFATPK